MATLVRDLFDAANLAGRTIVDTEGNKVTISGGDLNIAGLATSGWQRAGVYYPGQARVNGLAFGARVQFTDVQQPFGATALTDAPYAIGLFAAANPSAPLTSGHNVALVNASELGGKFLVGDSTQRLVTPSVKQVEHMAFVVARDRGAIYYLASLPGVRNVGGYPNMRPVSLDQLSTAATLYPGIHSRSVAGLRAGHVTVETLGAPFDKWYQAAHAADNLYGSGALGNAETGQAWTAGNVQRTSTGAQRTATGSFSRLNPGAPSGLIAAEFILGTGYTNEIRFRWVDANNYWTLVFFSTGWRLDRFVNGSQTTVQSGPSNLGAAGGTGRVVVQDDGSTIRWWGNGTVFDSVGAVASTVHNTGYSAGFVLSENNSRCARFEMHPRTVPIPAELVDEGPFLPAATRNLTLQELFDGAGDMEGKVADVGGLAVSRTRGPSTATRNGSGAASLGTVTTDTHYTYALDSPYLDIELDFTPPGTTMGDGTGSMATIALEGTPTTFTPTFAAREFIQDSQPGNTEYEGLWTNAAGEYIIRARTAMALDLTKGTPRSMRLVASETAKRYIVYDNAEPVITGIYDFAMNRAGWGAGGGDTGTLLREFRMYTLAATSLDVAGSVQSQTAERATVIARVANSLEVQAAERAGVLVGPAGSVHAHTAERAAVSATSADSAHSQTADAALITALPAGSVHPHMAEQAATTATAANASHSHSADAAAVEAAVADAVHLNNAAVAPVVATPEDGASADGSEAAAVTVAVAHSTHAHNAETAETVAEAVTVASSVHTHLSEQARVEVGARDSPHAHASDTVAVTAAALSSSQDHEAQPAQVGVSVAGDLHAHAAESVQVSATVQDAVHPHLSATVTLAGAAVGYITRPGIRDASAVRVIVDASPIRTFADASKARAVQDSSKVRTIRDA